MHSHIRRALKDGLNADELRQVALLAIPTLGLSTAVRAMTWMDDVLGTKAPKAKKRTKR